MPATDIKLSELKNRKLGRVLTKLGKVTREQVHEAMAIQRSKSKKALIGELLVELQYITQRDVQEALAGQAGMGFIDLDEIEIDEETIGAIPAETAKAYQVVPFEYESATKKLKVALKTPDNFRAVDDLRLLMGFKVEAFVADEAQIDERIKRHYAKSQSVSDLVSDIASDEKFQ